MKILIVNKDEKKQLIHLLKQEICKSGCPYELTTLLEKLSPGDYKYLFSTMKYIRKEVDTLFNKMVDPSEEELTTLLGLSE